MAPGTTSEKQKQSNIYNGLRKSKVKSSPQSHVTGLSVQF